MTKIINEAKIKMTKICRKVAHVNIRLSILERVSFIKQFFRFIWDRIVDCSIGKPIRYRRLPYRGASAGNSPAEVAEDGSPSDEAAAVSDSDPDSVTLKISLLGDCQIGKTSFVVSSPLLFLFFKLIEIHVTCVYYKV